MPNPIRLLEPDYDDLRDILEMLPTVEVEHASALIGGEVYVNEIVPAKLSRAALTDLAIRIGEIYSRARSRAMLEAYAAEASAVGTKGKL